MAINFEAANMAGYNNPQIEVFKATVNTETYKITDAPSKTNVIRCLNRGSIPLILLSDPDGIAIYALWIQIVKSDGTLYFDNGSMALTYSPDSEQPTVGAGG